MSDVETFLELNWKSHVEHFLELKSDVETFLELNNVRCWNIFRIKLSQMLKHFKN